MNRFTFLLALLLSSQFVSGQDFNLEVTSGNVYTPLDGMPTLLGSWDANSVTSGDFGAALNWFQRSYVFDGTAQNGPIIGGPGYIIAYEHADSTGLILDPCFSSTLVSRDGSSEIRAGLGGTAPDRILAIEWKNAGFVSGDASNFMNFEIILYESEPTIEVHIGPNKVSGPVFTSGTSGPRIGFCFTDEHKAKGGATSKTFFLSGDPKAPKLIVRKTDNSSVLSSMPAEGTVYRFTSSSETAGSAKAFFRALDELSLYPNPANGLVTLNPHMQAGEQVNVQLLDMSGRLVKEVYSGSIVSTTIGFTVNDVKPGVYLVRVQSKAGVQTKKLSVR